MKISVQWLRRRASWFLVVPFLWFARPAPDLLLIGAVLAAVGLSLRAWAAGVIHKDAELATTGPYAFTRNPLYLGSLLLGLGTVIAGGRWIFAMIFLTYFAGVYGRTMKREEAFLEGRFGDRYRDYARRVPLLVPRLSPFRASEWERSGRFSPARYVGHREWEALLGAVAGFAFLTAKMLWM